MGNEDAANPTNSTARNEKNVDDQATPGSKGYPEPGSGHDESETVTVEDGPPIKKTDGVPGAFGDVETGIANPKIRFERIGNARCSWYRRAFSDSPG